MAVVEYVLAERIALGYQCSCGAKLSSQSHGAVCWAQVQQWRAAGKEPYAYSFQRTHMAAQLQAEYADLPNGEVRRHPCGLVACILAAGALFCVRHDYLMASVERVHDIDVGPCMTTAWRHMACALPSVQHRMCPTQ